MAPKNLPPAVLLSMAIPFLVFGAPKSAATMPLITVLSPVNQSKVSSPVHYVASAESPQCSKGISVMRIYTVAHHISSYSVNTGSVDTLLILLPGAHRTVIEASDKCGGVSKAEVDITVSAS